MYPVIDYTTGGWIWSKALPGTGKLNLLNPRVCPDFGGQPKDPGSRYTLYRAGADFSARPHPDPGIYKERFLERDLGRLPLPGDDK
jgi:hypothetical protein